MFLSIALVSSTIVQASQVMRVEKVKAADQLEQERALFVSFYKGLYQGKTAQELGLNDLDKDLGQRFDKEKAQLKDPKSGLVALRVVNKGKLAGLAVFKELDNGQTLRLMRCAFDMKQDMFSAGKLLVQEIFKHFPNVQKVVNVALKESKIEVQLLKQFGFSERALVDTTYDNQRYTSYALARPKQS